MKRRIGLVIATLLILIGIFILVKVAASTIAPRGKGALQVTSSIKATVFLDNRTIGTTPVSLSDPSETIAAGDYTLKIVPSESDIQPFTVRIKINPNVLTAVDRTFLPGALSSASILTLEKINDKNAELFISTVPDATLVTLDGESQGVTPLDMKSVAPSEHDIELEKVGFAKKTIRIRTVAGYKLVLNAILGTEGADIENSNTQVATPSGTIQSTTPTPTATKVVIGTTPNGFLRVRADASTTAAEVGRVTTGATVKYLDETDGWYKVQLDDGSIGWVSQDYSSKE